MLATGTPSRLCYLNLTSYRSPPIGANLPIRTFRRSCVGRCYRKSDPFRGASYRTLIRLRLTGGLRRYVVTGSLTRGLAPTVCGTRLVCRRLAARRRMRRVGVRRAAATNTGPVGQRARRLIPPASLIYDIEFSKFSDYLLLEMEGHCSDEGVAAEVCNGRMEC
jgi:hypothetical protein